MENWNVFKNRFLINIFMNKIDERKKSTTPRLYKSFKRNYSLKTFSALLFLLRIHMDGVSSNQVFCYFQIPSSISSEKLFYCFTKTLKMRYILQKNI